MVTFPPYLASAGWYNRWLGAMKVYGDDETAIKQANCFIKDGRILSRTRIRNSGGDDIILSIAIQGGSRQLRSLHLNNVFWLSAHGDWRKNHISAIEAAYGKKPFFSHVFNKLKDCFTVNNEDNSLQTFNLALHNVIKKLLLGNIGIENIVSLEDNLRVIERGKELANEIDEEISVIDALMQLGPEAILGIFALNYNPKI